MLSFSKTGITFASFRNDWKSPLLIEALIEGWTKSVNMSAFSLIILVGTSVSWQALETSKQTISWKISYSSTFEKLNQSFDFWTLSIAFILTWYLYFDPLSAIFTKWSDTLKQFVGKLPTNRLSVFEHFVGLALKGLK